MFNILVTCDQPELASFFKIAKNILNIVQLIGPILCIISLIIFIIRLINNPENKKEIVKIKNIIIALVLVFFIPLIVNVTMKICDDSFNFSACWNYGDEYVEEDESEYIGDPNQEPGSIIIDPDDYDSGESVSENSNN